LIKRLTKRLGTAGTVVLLLAVLGATAALAAIILRAEVTGSAATGAEVEFEFAIDATGTDTGALTCRWGIDTDGDGNLDDFATDFPAGLGCNATVTAGVLDVDLTGDWLPGEGVVVWNTHVSNPSAVDISIIDWDFGASDLGLRDSGAAVEVATQSAVNLASQGTDNGLPPTVASGATEPLGLLVLQIAPEAPFSTAFAFDGTAVIGQTTR